MQLDLFVTKTGAFGKQGEDSRKTPLYRLVFY